MESFFSRRSQVSLYCAKTMTFALRPELRVWDTRLMVLETFGCSTLEVLATCQAARYSLLPTSSLLDFEAFAPEASSFSFVMYALSGVMPWVSARSIACRILMHIDCTERPL